MTKQNYSLRNMGRFISDSEKIEYIEEMRNLRRFCDSKHALDDFCGGFDKTFTRIERLFSGSVVWFLRRSRCCMENFLGKHAPTWCSSRAWDHGRRNRGGISIHKRTRAAHDRLLTGWKGFPPLCRRSAEWSSSVKPMLEFDKRCTYFLASPWVCQIIHETMRRASARCECAKHTTALIKAVKNMNQKSVSEFFSETESFCWQIGKNDV